MKSARRFLSILLTVCLLLGLVSGGALATEHDPVPFSDVNEADWFYRAVGYAYENSLMSGTGEGRFSPTMITTRGMIVTVLYRLEGSPKGAAAPFDDVAQDAYYAAATGWAAANGVVIGYDNGRFGPEDPVTREQMATILYRYAQYKEYDATVSGDAAAFADYAAVSSYAVAAMDWAVGTKLMSGVGENRLNPGGSATRAELAMLLMNFCQNFAVELPGEDTPLGDEPICQVTFDYNYGGKGTYETAEVPVGATVDKPASPARSGYTFTGWYTQAVGGAKFDFDEAVAADMTLYAHWNVSSSGGGSASPDPAPAYCTVSFNSNGGSPVESQTVKNGTTATLPDDPTQEGYLFMTWYSDVGLTKAFDFTTPVTDDLTLYASWLSLQDTDEDGLVDELEAHYGTDSGNPDTDGDGLSDYIEVVILGTDPLSPATGGVADGDLDSDGDGISNLDEVMQGTDPGDPDTDGDLLTDAEEATYGTDPTRYDTDGDGASDGTEVRLGTNPLVADASFDVTVSSDVGDTVSPSVEVTLSGQQVDTLAVDPITDAYLFPENMPGYLGKAYNFSVSGDFDTATIRFSFDPAILETGAEPTIFYFNEADQSLEELPTTIEGNVASTVVEHFSTYVLIDRVVYDEAFTWEDVWDADGEFNSLEIVLVIDDSASMSDNDPSNQRLSVAQALIDKLPEDSKIGVVRFEAYTDLLTSALTADRNAAKSYLTGSYFTSNGYSTYMYTAINDSFSLFESTEDQVLRMMVVLSDGNTFDTGSHSSAVTAALKQNVRIYTVGLGSSTSYFNAYLRPLAAETGGAFYLASNASELASIYEQINKEIDLKTDTDGDGVPDYYEDHMVAFNGLPIEMDKNNPDTDGDGLTDGEEVEVELVYNEDQTQVYVKGKLNSYPDKVDSDHDGILDYYDPDPMEFTITDRVLSWVAGLSYTNLSPFVGKTVEYAQEHGASIQGISGTYLECLGEAVIVQASDSGMGYWKDFWDSGLGSVALKFVRTDQPTAVVLALRGTEFGSDFIHDTGADVALGVGWDCNQSRNAFSVYKSISTNSSYDYYVTGHSLGGRLVQDVLYKTYNANASGANLRVPVHSATFNGLGYNKLVYATLKNNVLAGYAGKLTNYYYWLDLVGEGFGHNLLYTRAGRDVQLMCRDINGSYYRAGQVVSGLVLRDCDYHGINYFQNDYDLLYADTDLTSGAEMPGERVSHAFSYWVN